MNPLEEAFYGTLSALAAGRARKVLGREIRYLGKVARRADHILALLDAGRRVEVARIRDYDAEAKLLVEIDRPRSSNLNRWHEEDRTRAKLRAELDRLREGVPVRRLVGEVSCIDERDWGATVFDFAAFVQARREAARKEEGKERPPSCDGCGCALAPRIGGIEDHRAGCPNFPL